MIPEGLELCRWCGGIRGSTAGQKSFCLCEGVTCKYCCAGRTQRPISDRFNPVDGKFWHMFYLGAGIPCAHCQGLANEIAGRGVSWPGPIQSDPLVRERIETIAAAAKALTAESARAEIEPGAAAYVVALRGDPIAWAAVSDDPAPGDRPLWVGTGTEAARLPAAPLWQLIALCPLDRDAFDCWYEEHLTVASWPCREGTEARWLAHELKERWRPPLR